ncbi:hypothetical protein LMG31506_01306 [Cupriavidus yeoncheonensis]|uniref:Uncharacterized protein n=1 Tax=Cupriavidus yeoncheonensis TaxID=1462994 RepID=A0A916IRF9_9BURK|nr:hypothetical protein LMG31506_01306 [Cupriavidus yeoncheonensis]
MLSPDEAQSISRRQDTGPLPHVSLPYYDLHRWPS